MFFKTLDLGGGLIAIKAASGSMTIHKDFQVLFFSPASALLLSDLIIATDIDATPRVSPYHWLGADAELV